MAVMKRDGGGGKIKLCNMDTTIATLSDFHGFTSLCLKLIDFCNVLKRMRLFLGFIEIEDETTGPHIYFWWKHILPAYTKIEKEKTCTSLK